MDVANCQVVSEKGLQELNAGCPGLQHMDAAKCHKVSEEGFQALTASCPGLQSVDVASCQMASKEGLPSGTECRLPRVAGMDVANC